MTLYAGIIGHPLKHSISPAFQQAAFNHLALGIEYRRWDLAPGELRDAVERLKGQEYLGCNVTVPYKEKLISLVDSLADSAKNIGAVNTVVNRGGKLEGHNTDAKGFLSSMKEEAAFDTRGAVALVLGAGGAARAICFGLIEAGADRVYITNRSPERAHTLATILAHRTGARIVTMPWKETEFERRLPECHLIVNCTTMGMKHGVDERQSPLPASLIPSSALVYDVVYNPAQTPLLKEAAKAGARTVGGLSMLIYQGAASFELWTGKQAPIEVMFKAGRAAMLAQEQN